MVVSWLSVLAVEISKKYEVKFEYISARCLQSYNYSYPIDLVVDK